MRICLTSVCAVCAGTVCAAAFCVGTASCTTVRHPGAPATSEPPAGTFHTMRPGETLWDLSRQSGLSVDEIAEVNGIPSADDVAAGQRIFLPAGAMSEAAGSAPAERAEPEAPPAGPAALSWPVDGVVLRDFKAGAYDGVLVAAPAGTPVTAAAAGAVVFTGDQHTSYGLLVVVKHAGDLTTVYGDLGGVDVAVGDTVQAGQKLGVVGTSGGQETPRLHFQVRRGRTAVDPLPLLP